MTELVLRALRRALFVPMVFVVAAISLALFPLLALLALGIGLVRGDRFAAFRMLLALQFDALLEATALVLSGLVWLRWFGRWKGPGFREDSYAVGAWWAGTIIDALGRIYELRFEGEGLDEVLPGPILLLPRHVSIADTLMPVALFTRRHGLNARYVVKRQLELDPVLDIMGHRVPTAFVKRHGQDPEGDLARVRSLAEDLHPDDMIVIYPEGTRFTPGKRARLERKAEELHDEAFAARVERYHHTLPPHHAGTLALLDRAPGLDVVFLAHTGFDGILHLQDLASGILIGRVIRMKAWRVSWEELPSGTEERAAWLDEQWARVDDWVAEHPAQRR